MLCSTLYNTLHPAVLVEVTTATTPKSTTPPPFGPSMDSLWYPCITTTHLSYSVLSLKLPPPPCAALRVYDILAVWIDLHTGMCVCGRVSFSALQTNPIWPCRKKKVSIEKCSEKGSSKLKGELPWYSNGSVTQAFKLPLTWEKATTSSGKAVGVACCQTVHY